MTPNEKLKCIAEQAVYEDLKVFNMSLQQYEDIALIGLPRENDWKINCLRIACYKPALRPLSDLTKEITHKGYNDDKPFVPIVKLFEHLQGIYLTEQDKSDFEIFFNSDSDSCEHDADGWCVMIFDDLKLEINVCGVPAFFCYDTDSFNWKYNFTTVSQSYYDLLHLLHFDTRNLIKKGEAIDVNTLDINPYEV